MERLINRRQQGDLGEASAIEWLTSVGATVLIPFGHSPDFDLVAYLNSHLLRVQVKTSTQTTRTPDGHLRSSVNLATNGGNQSWNRLAKKLDPSRFDYLFALTADGRRWFIPSTVVEAQSSISLGGRKYSEFEIEPGRAIHELVYGMGPALESKRPAGEYPSGQRTAAVNRWPYGFAGSNPASPMKPRPGFPPSKYDRKLGRSGQTIINQKRRVTIPRDACIDAGLTDGDRLRVRAAGDGRLMLERIEPPPDTAPGRPGSDGGVIQPSH